MSDAKSSPSDGGKETTRRNLPSWMSSEDNGKKSRGKKPDDSGEHGEDDEVVKRKQTTGRVKAHCYSVSSKEAKCSEKSANGDESVSSIGTLNFSKLLEGVVFVLSGFVNPERSILRSQALEMGAKYQPDWNSDCTLLVCAFPNTPKFQQVAADCGTIVSKGWISECYNQKKLVAIETYLMHAGNPWRRNSISHESSQDQETTPPRKPNKQAERRSGPKSSFVASSKVAAPNPVKDNLSPSNLKKWAIDDLNKTISWLESQEETPEPSEVKKIAAEGIITCLQDAIEALKQKQDIRQVTEEWKFVPHVVEKLAGLDGVRSGTRSLSKEDLYQRAMTCKRIYQKEYNSLENEPILKKKKSKTDDNNKDDGENIEPVCSDAAYDSDETIEMTEEEIDIAYKTITSKMCK